MFRDAYRLRCCILPVDAFYECKAIKGRKQPCAIAMKEQSPFGIAGLCVAGCDKTPETDPQPFPCRGRIGGAAANVAV